MESPDHIQSTIAEIRTTPGTVSEADQLLAMAAEAQRTGKLPDLTVLDQHKITPTKPEEMKSESQARVVDGVTRPVIVNPSIFRRLIDRLFRYESMSGAGLCPVYLERWTFFYKFGFGIYLHHFIGDDWSLDPHDHPRRFISIGLKGWYWEDVFAPNGVCVAVRKFTAPWARSFPAEHLHRVRAAECGNCWTLVIVLRKTRGWGFVRDGKWVPFREYVFGGGARRACSEDLNA